MLTQEELDRKFPLSQASEELEPRYVVTWCKGTCEGRSLVNVFDKFVGRSIFRDSTSDKKKSYDYIKRNYGEKNCVRPKEVTESFMKLNT